MNSIDTSITHSTFKKDNVFEDLGFAHEEASELTISIKLYWLDLSL